MINTVDFRISKGDLTQVSDTLSNDSAPMDLTGCTVTFNFQLVTPDGSGVSYSKPATVTDAVNGKVAYTFAIGETTLPGLFQAQWAVTNAGGATTTFPTGSLDNDDANGRYILYEIVDTVPVSPEAGIMLISETYEGIRAILGDHNPQFRKYEDKSIAAVVRTCLRCGRVPRYTVTPNGMGISPAITVPWDFGILIHHAAKMFVLPDAADYSYKTRALSERFGEQKVFIQELTNAIYDIENGPGVFHTFQSFYGWVNALTGINIWSVMTDMATRAPVATVVIGRAGINVNTT